MISCFSDAAAGSFELNFKKKGIFILELEVRYLYIITNTQPCIAHAANSDRLLEIYCSTEYSRNAKKASVKLKELFSVGWLFLCVRYAIYML